MEVPQFFYPMPLDVRPVIQTARPLCPRSDFEWGGPYHPSDNGLSPALFASDDYGITPPVSSSSGVVPLDPYRLESPHGPPPAYQVEEQYLSQRTQADVVPRNVPADVYPVTIDTNSAGLGVHESYSFANTSHPLFFPSQQLPPTLSPQQPLRPPSWEPFPASPLPLRDTATHTPPPFPAHWPTPKSMIPCAVDPISPTEILAYITLLGGEGCTCTWGRSSGGTCWFRSSVNGVKRHVRRVHFGAKRVFPTVEAHWMAADIFCLKGFYLQVLWLQVLQQLCAQVAP